MKKKVCTLGNTCGKDICCEYCSNTKCIERCTDCSSICGYAMSKGNAIKNAKNLTIEESMGDEKL